MDKEESINEIVKFVQRFPEGIVLYDLADNFKHLSDTQYAEHLNRAIKRRKISLRGFSVFPGKVKEAVEQQ